MFFSIQFLRFLAALAVVIDHTINFVWWKGHIGACGLDVFFVISGFVISYSTRPDETVREFVAKRVIRVFPIYWLATAALLGFQYGYWRSTPDPEQLLRSLFLIPQLGIHWQPIYFPAWTLVYECFFYGLFAVLLALTRKNCRLACMVVLAAMAAVIIPVHWNGGTLMTDILMEFVFGLLIAEALPILTTCSQGEGIALIVVSLALFTINYDPGHAPPRPISWGIPAALLVAGFIAIEPLRFFQMRFIRLLGAASYSIYLFHMTALQCIEETGKRHGIVVYDTVGGGVLWLLASVGCGVLMHLYVEKPTLSFLRKRVLHRVTDPAHFN